MTPGSMGEANLDGDQMKDAMKHGHGDDVADEVVEEVESGDEIFEVDGDTTGADPDAADPAVNIRPHKDGNLA